MENLRAKNTLRFYKSKFGSKLAKFNLPAQLPDYFEPMIGDKKEVNIAELGAGPICTIGNSWKDVKVNIYASDVLQNEFAPQWKKHGATPIVPIEYQDMEHLSYPDEFFDIVHCANAVDHTLDARQALREMLRICKIGGWIYLRHFPNQRTKLRGMHEWNIDAVDGECVVFKRRKKFLLSEFGNFKTHKENDLIISIMQKTDSMKELTKLGIKYGTDKATYHLYTEIYDDYFKKFNNPNILEIGVHRGASLQMHNEYFNEKCNIVGLDSRDRLKYKGNGKNIKIITGDQSKIEDLKKCVDAVKEKEYDIIIDDGGHFVKAQQISFSFLFDFVKKKGIYIIEDLQTSFSEKYNPEKNLNTIDFLNQLDKGVYSSLPPHISQNDFGRLKKQIKSVEIFWKTPKQDIDNSITSIITKN